MRGGIRSLLISILALAGESISQSRIEWSHLGGGIARNPGILGVAGQTIQGVVDSDSEHVQAGFLVGQGLLNNAPAVKTPMSDQRRASGFHSEPLAISEFFFDEDGDRLEYRVECDPAFVCQVSGDTFWIAGRPGAAGAGRVVLVASDPEGAIGRDSFEIEQRKTPMPSGWDSLKIYGDPAFDLTAWLDSGWWFASSAPEVVAVESKRLSWLHTGRADVWMAAPGGDTLRWPLFVRPRRIVVRAVAGSKLQGGAEPELEYVADGLVGSDKISGRLVRDLGESVGEYAIRRGTLEAGGDYSMDFEEAVFRILATSGVASRKRPDVRSTELQIRVHAALARIQPGWQLGVIGRNLSECQIEGGCTSIEVRGGGLETVRIHIFDHQGTHVIDGNWNTHADEFRPSSRMEEGDAGMRFEWNLRARDGRIVVPGVYLWKVEARTKDGRVLEEILKTGVR